MKKQKKIVLDSFNIPKTMKMVSVETGIDRANICRYIAKWMKDGIIELVGKSNCRVTGAIAGYYIIVLKQ